MDERRFRKSLKSEILKDFELFKMEHNIESTPQDSGPTEYANRIVVAMAKCMLKAQKLKKSLWIEGVANGVYTLNIYPTRVFLFVHPKKRRSRRRP